MDEVVDMKRRHSRSSGDDDDCVVDEDEGIVLGQEGVEVLEALDVMRDVGDEV